MSLSEVRASRAFIEEHTDLMERAVLNPNDPGGLSAAERLAFAERIARLAGDQDQAEIYGDALFKMKAPEELLAIGRGIDPSGPRLKALVAHLDLVTVRPKDARSEHIAALRTAGVSDADIVRLSEIVGFMNYKVRVNIGLSMLESVQ